jgi:tripeptide aminopeptidase
LRAVGRARGEPNEVTYFRSRTVDRLLDRFCRYVEVETTAVEESKQYPSSPGQRELGKMLAAELEALELDDVGVDKHGIVMATIPGNVNKASTIAWLAHMDTSPEASAKNVQPVIHRKYNGKDIVLPRDKSKVIRVAETRRCWARTTRPGSQSS